MPNVFKIALPGYNASLDTNPDHFALYVDNSVDYVLIKEKVRHQVTVSSSFPHSTMKIPHGLGYVPFCLAFVETSSGVWRKLFSTAINGLGCRFEINSTELLLINESGGVKAFAYYIFYDNIT